MYVEDHGGDCCGIFHLYGFTGYGREGLKDKTRKWKIEKVKETLNDHFEWEEDSCNYNLPRLIEAVINQNQVDELKMDKVLVSVGFNLVNQFRNGNTGNMCYIYHMLYKEQL